MDKKATVVVDDDEPRGLGRTPRGRLLLTVFLLITLTAVLISVMPNSTIKSSLLAVARPFQYAVGVDQSWGVFAPNPRRNTSYVFARIERADGSVAARTIPTDRGLSAYSNYRWRKFGEQLWSPSTSAADRAGFARWIVDRDLAAGERPVRVTLLRHTRATRAPGPGADYGPWREVAFYSMEVSRP